ncbi:unnamed protein product [Bubo scandiacus]
MCISHREGIISQLPFAEVLGDACTAADGVIRMSHADVALIIRSRDFGGVSLNPNHGQDLISALILAVMWRTSSVVGLVQGFTIGVQQQIIRR